MSDLIRVIETHERTGLQREYEIPAVIQGVAFNPPPDTHIGPITAAINDAMAQLKPGSHGALVGIVNESGANAAIVSKVGKGFIVEAWIGKSWKGSLDYGAAVKKEW